MIIGTLSGTYSTIAIATPMLHHPRAMWVVTIILAALTLTGLVWLIPIRWVSLALTLIIVVGALAGLARQLAGLRAPPGRQPLAT